MDYNGKLLARARERLARLREENAAEQRRRTAEAYARLPRLRELDRELRMQMIELARLAMDRSAAAKERLASLRDENLALQAERAELLVSAGFPADYTDEIYSCPDCHDTGIKGTGICHCLKKLYKRELTDELSTLLHGGQESFERFDLGWYDAAPDTVTGESPRECMSLICDTCREYAKNFGKGSANLIFMGGPGLGKTYLSACIARVVAERGCSVAYESAAAALSAFETQRFSRDGEESAAAASRVREYLGCDLMILDDLGTEMVTSFSVSALYQLINTRLNSAKPTIISTNCTMDELERKYGPQIMSRLEGEYLLLTFHGRDIRLQRKERGI